MITLKEILVCIAAVFVGSISYLLLLIYALPAWIVVLVAAALGGSMGAIFLRS